MFDSVVALNFVAPFVVLPSVGVVVFFLLLPKRLSIFCIALSRSARKAKEEYLETVKELKEGILIYGNSR